MKDLDNQIAEGCLHLMQEAEDGIKIVFTGDFCPVNRVEALCQTGNYDAVYNDTLMPLRSADAAVTNLECPLTVASQPALKAGPSLRAHPDCIGVLTFAGFNVIALANNHIMDQGESGLIDTIETCRNAGLQTVGAGESLNIAQNPLVLNIKGIRIAILNVAEREFGVAGQKRAGINPLNPVRNYSHIENAHNFADHVFVVLHGGNEHAAIPSPRMVETCRFFAELGVAGVICHHTHHASGLEVYKGTPIFYGLGNFLFDYPVDDRFSHWYEGYWVTVHLGKPGISRIELNPYIQCLGEPGIFLMQHEKRASFLNKIKAYSGTIQSDDALQEHWENLCRQKHVYYLSHALRLNRFQRHLYMKKSRVGKDKYLKHLLTMYNMFHCDAHRDVMISVLEEEIDRSR